MGLAKVNYLLTTKVTVIFLVNLTILMTAIPELVVGQQEDGRLEMGRLQNQPGSVWQ